MIVDHPYLPEEMPEWAQLVMRAGWVQMVLLDDARELRLYDTTTRHLLAAAYVPKQATAAAEGNALDAAIADLLHRWAARGPKQEPPEGVNV